MKHTQKHTKWFVIGALAFAPAMAHADNWPCEVVLCLANPQGATAVAPCVPPIKKLWKELAKGHAFPTCDMNSGDTSGNSASHQWASGNNCPEQYRYYGGPDNSDLLCEFRGVVTIKLANQLHTRVWWNETQNLTQSYGPGMTAPTETNPQMPVATNEN